MGIKFILLGLSFHVEFNIFNVSYIGSYGSKRSFSITPITSSEDTGDAQGWFLSLHSERLLLDSDH